MTERADTVPDNVRDLLTQLAANSRGELDLVQALADAVRRADEQVLRDIRTVTLQHERRREEIIGELHTLATRLCCLPGRSPAPHVTGPARTATRTAIRQQAHATEGGGSGSIAVEDHSHGDNDRSNGKHYDSRSGATNVAATDALNGSIASSRNGALAGAMSCGGDWREAAQKIDDELDFTFSTLNNRH